MIFRFIKLFHKYNGYCQTSNIMMLVCLATVPGVILQLYFFGWGMILQLCFSCVSAVIAEAIVLRLRKINIMYTLGDNSALTTGLLLAIGIPPFAPWWIGVLGSLIAIIVAKQIYGGLGHNLFNPAMVGYAVLLTSFPVQMTNWLPACEINTTAPAFPKALKIIFTGGDNVTESNASSLCTVSVDGISQETPLDTFKMSPSISHDNEIMRYPRNNIPESTKWQWINLAYLLGGIFLLKKRVICWHIPASFLASFSFCIGIGWIFSPEFLAILRMHLFSGATMLGAFFILTDPVTASTTSYGRLIFGALAGVFLWMIRRFGNYPDGVAFAVLLSNVVVPLIDHYMHPRVYGHGSLWSRIRRK